MFALSCLFVLSSMLLFRGVLSAPMGELGLDVRSSVEKRDVPSAPRWVIYSDRWVSGENGPPAASEIAGYNVL